MLNSLSRDEVLDLLAYLLAQGNRERPVFASEIDAVSCGDSAESERDPAE